MREASGNKTTNESCKIDPLLMWPSGGDGTTLCRTEGWTHIKRRAPITVGNRGWYQHANPKSGNGAHSAEGSTKLKLVETCNSCQRKTWASHLARVNLFWFVAEVVGQDPFTRRNTVAGKHSSRGPATPATCGVECYRAGPERTQQHQT